MKKKQHIKDNLQIRVVSHLNTKWFWPVYFCLVAALFSFGIEFYAILLFFYIPVLFIYIVKTLIQTKKDGAVLRYKKLALDSSIIGTIILLTIIGAISEVRVKKNAFDHLVKDINVYKKIHGKFPNSLRDMVPEFYKEVPRVATFAVFPLKSYFYIRSTRGKCSARIDGVTFSYWPVSHCFF